MDRCQALLLSAADEVSSSLQAIVNAEIIMLTFLCSLLLRLMYGFFPIWTPCLPWVTAKAAEGDSRSKKVICYITLHLIVMTLAASCQLAAVVASKGFAAGPCAHEGYRYLLHSTRLLTASFFAEMLFVDGMKATLALHHLISIYVIAHLPAKGMDPFGPAIACQQLACFWLLQGTFDHFAYIGVLGHCLGWDELIRNRILLLGTTTATIIKTISNVGVFFTWSLFIQPYASGWLTFGFYFCAGSLAVKQLFTIKALRRMARRRSAIIDASQDRIVDVPVAPTADALKAVDVSAVVATQQTPYNLSTTAQQVELPSKSSASSLSDASFSNPSVSFIRCVSSSGHVSHIVAQTVPRKRRARVARNQCRTTKIRA